MAIAFPQAAAKPAAGGTENASQPDNAARPKAARIAIRSNGRIVLIDPAEIFSVEAQGNYVLLRQSVTSHLLREQISVLADALQPYGLIRIHRSVLVNATHVEGVEPLLTGEYRLRMEGGRAYKVTRTYKKNLRRLAATWIGREGFVSK